MSHFPVVVIMDELTDDVEEVAAHLLAPFDENDEAFRDGSRWDWWVVGGRWDGAMLGLSDLDLKEICKLCLGSGVRPGGLEEFGADWFEWCKGCNGCMGTGQTAVSTNDHRYKTLDRNRGLVKEIAPDFIPQAFVTPDGIWHEKARMGWFGLEMADEDGRLDEKVGAFDQEWAAVRQNLARHPALLVDCHV